MRRRIFRFAAGAAIVSAILLAALGCGGDSESESFQMMRFGPGMMGYGPIGAGEPVRDLVTAQSQAESFADRLDLRVGEVMQFTNNFYAELLDDGGKLATEVLVDPSTGAVWFEYGPAMMWNTDYGMMTGFDQQGGGMMMGGGMMGGGPFGDPTWEPTQGSSDEPTVSAVDAERIVDEWLAGEGPNLHADDPEAFPGYYTLPVLRNDRISGMVSVNGYTGALWYHWWHGRFLGMTE